MPGLCTAGDEPRASCLLDERSTNFYFSFSKKKDDEVAARRHSDVVGAVLLPLTLIIRNTLPRASMLCARLGYEL